jgi:hypothetical protein
MGDYPTIASFFKEYEPYFYLVCYGPERNYRSNYRGEHHGVFGARLCQTAEEAELFIVGLGYLGHYSEMDIRVIENTAPYSDIQESEVKLPFHISLSK